MTRLYLAGKMRGVRDFNFPLFFAIAGTLRHHGYEVFCPAEHDVAVYGPDRFKSESGEDVIDGFDLRDALATDVEYIARYADGIAVLSDWQSSAGARAEVALADALGLPVKGWGVWIDQAAAKSA